jgi:hypothetical protein
MIGKKLLLIQDGQITYKDNADTFLKAQYLEEVKHAAIINIKKHSYNGLVNAIRMYVRSSNFAKNKIEEIKLKMKEKLSKHGSSQNSVLPEKQEVSKFLKMISEYKQKIRTIKRKIKEEEEQM